MQGRPIIELNPRDRFVRVLPERTSNETKSFERLEVADEAQRRDDTAGKTLRN